VVTNAGSAVHEFTVGDAAAQRRHADEVTGMGGMAHDEPGPYEAGMRGVIAVG
jgi:uncharacterized cupredoxin-like copper-binding protein